MFRHETEVNPENYGNFPTFRYKRGEVEISIGGKYLHQKLGSEPVRFRRHGSFQLVALSEYIAWVRMRVPRKGWNRVGSVYEHTFPVHVDVKVIVRQGCFYQHTPDCGSTGGLHVAI